MYINSESILSPHVARALPQACEDNSSFGLCVKGTVLDANTKTYIYIYIYKKTHSLNHREERWFQCFTGQELVRRWKI